MFLFIAAVMFVTWIFVGSRLRSYTDCHSIRTWAWTCWPEWVCARFTSSLLLYTLQHCSWSVTVSADSVCQCKKADVLKTT